MGQPGRLVRTPGWGAGWEGSGLWGQFALKSGVCPVGGMALQGEVPEETRLFPGVGGLDHHGGGRRGGGGHRRADTQLPQDLWKNISISSKVL